MLLSRRRNINSPSHDITSVHNYYERLVTDAIQQKDPRALTDYDYMDDVTCVALNHLPPRYIRHDVDMNFYLSPIEIDEIQMKVDKAVSHAIEFVQTREKKNRAAENSDDSESH